MAVAVVGSAEHRRRSVLRAALVFGAAGAAAASWMDVSARAAPRRVLHVDPYHPGNEWNDRIAAAVVETLEAAGIEVRVFHLDTKRKPCEAEKRAAAARALALIEAFAPEVVTVSDDNAVKYLLMPRYRDAALPFVFCGLNWDASVYDLAYRNATGMVEVSPIPQLVALLRNYAHGSRLGYLASASTPASRPTSGTR